MLYSYFTTSELSSTQRQESQTKDGTEKKNQHMVTPYFYHLDSRKQ